MCEIGLAAIEVSSKIFQQGITSPTSPALRYPVSKYEISLFPKSEILLVHPEEVLWVKNDVLIRKLRYDTDQILNAHIVHYSNDSQNDIRKHRINSPNMGKRKALVVVLTNRAHVYFEDDETFIVSFPMAIRKSLMFENGLVLERQSVKSLDTDNYIIPLGSGGIPTHPKVNYLTLLDPLHELGMVVSSSTTSFSPNEELVWFPPDLKCSLAVTHNASNCIISIYHVRYLSRNKHKSGTKRSSVRKRSVSRKSSILHTAPTSSMTDTDMEEPKSGVSSASRRSLSHSEMLSYDRMASGADLTGIDINDASNLSVSNVSSSTVNSAPVFRKDMVLTKIEKVQFSHSRKHLKVFSVNFHNKQGIVIVNKETKDTEVLIFKSSNNSVNLPSYQSSFNFRCSDAIPLSPPGHEGYILSLKEDCKSLVLVNPFLGLMSHTLDGLFHILSLDGSSQYNVGLTTTALEKKIIKLLLHPLDHMTAKCLLALKHLLGSHMYEYVWLRWCAAKGRTLSDWHSFIVTLLSILVPLGTDMSNILVTNEVIEQLEKASCLNALKVHKYDKTLRELGPNIMLALHLLREELKLNILQNNARFDLLLAQLASWMGWSSIWIQYYTENTLHVDIMARFPSMEPLETPPNLLRSVCSIFTDNIMPYITFSQLTEENDAVDEIITPRTYYILRLFEAVVSPQFKASDVVNLMVEYGLDSFNLETYPAGISLPLKEYMAYCKNTTGTDSSLDVINLLGRKDLEKLMLGDKSVYKSRFSVGTTTKDVHQIVASIKSDEPFSTWDGHSEADRLAITRLIFSDDRRYYEITKLLQSSRIQTVSFHCLAEVNEYELLNLQKELAMLVCLRTLTIPLGRGALFLSTKMPILTEKFPIPKLNFDTLILPGNTTLSLDKDQIAQETMEWGYFHNGASAGLTILKDSKNIVGSWIAFNKPNVLNSQHGGFLLGLGLNGHLKSLEHWHVYNYLNPKHTHVSVGLLLGMSASARGSMDVKLTRVLSVHVVALLPHGATDLNVSLPVQTAGLIGIGLLYLESQNRKMSEILLSQISNKLSINDRYVVDEGYRLAAGIALGYVNLGKGNDLKGLNDSHLTDRLLSMAVSLKDAQASQEYDKSAPGAILALGFIYIMTENHSIAAKLDVPVTEKLLDYVRTDLLLLRIVAKNLILWNARCSKSWILSQIPECLLKKFSIASIERLDSDQLAYLNCLGGACLSIGLKYASTGNLKARDNILFYLDQFLRITSMETSTFDEKITQSSAAMIQHVVALSAALIMAGTGDIEVFRRLKALHERTSDTMTYSDYAALSMALGFLFIASGEYAFDNSKFAIAALLTSIYPAPANGEDSPVYLQALRHFWAMSVAPRCLVVRDVNSSKPIKVPVEVVLKSGRTLDLTAPCLIPKLPEVQYIRTGSSKYFEVLLDLEDDNKIVENFKNDLNVYVYERKQVTSGTENQFSSIVKSISNDFDQKKPSNTDKACELIYKDDYNINEHELKGKLLVNNSRLEAATLAKSPKSLDDLWNIKLLFAFYDRVEGINTYYLSAEFVEKLKIELWKFSQTLH